MHHHICTSTLLIVLGTHHHIQIRESELATPDILTSTLSIAIKDCLTELQKCQIPTTNYLLRTQNSILPTPLSFRTRIRIRTFYHIRTRSDDCMYTG